MVFIDVEFMYCYLVGVAIGVFIYLIIIMIFKEKGWISNFEDYASCRMNDDELDQSKPKKKEEK